MTSNTQYCYALGTDMVGVSETSTRKKTEQWAWTFPCPGCLTLYTLTPEDFTGEAKIPFKCKHCGIEKELDNPDQPDLSSKRW